MPSPGALRATPPSFRRPSFLASSLLLLLVSLESCHGIEHAASSASALRLASSNALLAAASATCKTNDDCNFQKCQSCYCEKPSKDPATHICNCAQGFSGAKCEIFCEHGCYAGWQLANPEYLRYFHSAHDQAGLLGGGPTEKGHGDAPGPRNAERVDTTGAGAPSPTDRMYKREVSDRTAPPGARNGENGR